MSQRMNQRGSLTTKQKEDIAQHKLIGEYYYAATTCNISGFEVNLFNAIRQIGGAGCQQQQLNTAGASTTPSQIGGWVKEKDAGTIYSSSCHQHFSNMPSSSTAPQQQFQTNQHPTVVQYIRDVHVNVNKTIAYHSLSLSLRICLKMRFQEMRQRISPSEVNLRTSRNNFSFQ